VRNRRGGGRRRDEGRRKEGGGDREGGREEGVLIVTRGRVQPKLNSLIRVDDVSGVFWVNGTGSSSAFMLHRYAGGACFQWRD